MIAANTDAVAADKAGRKDAKVRGVDPAHDGDAMRLQKASSLDRNTLGGIYDEYHPILYSYIYRRVGDVEVARDLTADVFRRFLQATANGNGPNAQLRAWLYRVAHNIVVDHYRRRKNQPGQLLQEQMPSEEADPGSAAEQRIQCEDVRRAMNHLTADQQEVIALKFLQGLTNDEIAHITRKSVGAVKALQHRALAALRRQLVPSLEEDTL
jgi:RNA polymerase sigma-70 factor (ECF subfamily)